jgi:regulatory subunit for Cdc7p protein kinase
MAAVSIPPSPQVISTMTSRRVPLASIPNATNSPFRAVAAAASKRQRSHASDQRELAYGQPPPAKKLIVEVDDAEARRHGLGRRTTHNPNAFQRKLEAARETKVSSKAAERPQKSTNENLESIRQWQKHYKRMFPTFVFYFDSMPDDVRSRASRQAHTLGAVSYPPSVSFHVVIVY